ncbi:MAG: ABC transporter substrate-binding protein [Eubacteriales bacterium]
MKKRTLNKLFALVLTGAMAFTMLAGCGSSTESTTTETAVETETTVESEVEAPEVEAGESVLELAVTTGDGSTTDDKIPTPWYNRIFATNLMFRSLFISDATLANVEGDLAESYTVSEDALTYTITLKEGLAWSDGEVLDAEDVIFSIETGLAAANINSIYTAAFSKITDLSAEGNVITIVLSEAYTDLIPVLAQFAILPQHSLAEVDPLTLDTDAFWTAPVTSGMYMLEELNVGNYFTLVLNPHYEGTTPQITKVINYFVSDFITAAQSGTVDYMFTNAADQVESMEAMDNFTSHQVDVLFYKYFMFNMEGIDGNQNEAMQNVAVREAIITAVDRATLSSLYPSALVLNSGVPDANEAYNGFVYEYDAEAAKVAIAESGYDMSRTLKICYYNNDQTSIDLINTVVYYLEQVGFTVEATLSNDGTTDLFTTRDYDIGFKGKSSFSITEWYTEYMSTDALFANVFGGTTEFDGLVSQLTSATDEATRNDVLTQLQELEQEKVYKVPVFTVGTYVYTSDSVTVPEDVTFCNPLYNCDVDFANWTMQ